ncbi:hypothetical protein VaNZ11_007051 [Volvox africanus]|uniref:ABC transporter domain-containing protein n=1 Tax=Volvox africanus TaxID=51714 RepID=A0ABQ5S1Y7_9CHLO|nr:hypothetical protein VaNZ11_007051 [Volvox africanus]
MDEATFNPEIIRYRQEASTRAQVRALLIKSAVYQRRNTATNVCLVVAPIFFCGLLVLLQALANKLILAARTNKCGCQCLQCCVPYRTQRNWTDAELERIANGEKLKPRYITTEVCSLIGSGYCERTRNATCREFNDSNCGLRFSKPSQAVFCAIPQPSSWPPVMQTPRLNVRAGGSTSQWLPFTGKNRTAAREVAANLVSEPELPNLQGLIDTVVDQPLSALSLTPKQILALVLPMLASGGLVQADGVSVDAAQLSRLELKFGSALTSNIDYYLENAFINTNTNNSRLQFLVPQGRCAATGISNVTTYTVLPLPEMLLRYYNASFPLIIPPLLRAFNVTPGQIATALESSPFNNITVACVDTLTRESDDMAALDRRLYCGFGKARCDGTFFTREYGAAWDFRELGPTKLKYDVYYNLSLPEPNIPVNYRIHELLNMATKAWTKTYWGNLVIVYTVRNRLMGLMSFPKNEMKLKLDFSILLGPLFYTWVVQMLMPSLLHQLVYEKEKRLRMMMKMHGLGDGAYWLVTYLWYLLVYIVYIAFFMSFGTLIRLKIFTTTSISLQAVMFFIFGNNMIAFIFMLSSFFSSSRTATVASFLYIFAMGLIGELLLRALMEENKPYILAVQLLPGFALYRGLFEFSAYSQRAIFGSGPGLGWSGLRDAGNGMIGVWVILLVEWPMFLTLAWYFEQVLNSGTGARRPPLFFLKRWRRKPDAEVRELQAGQPSNPLAADGSATAAPPDLVQTPLRPPPAQPEVSPEDGDMSSAASGRAGSPGSGGVVNGSRRGPGCLRGGATAVAEADCRDGGMADSLTADGILLPGRPIYQRRSSSLDGSGAKLSSRGAGGQIFNATGKECSTSRGSRNSSNNRNDSGDGAANGGGQQDLSIKQTATSSFVNEGGIEGSGGSTVPADTLIVSATAPETTSRRILSRGSNRSTQTYRAGSAGGFGAGGGGYDVLSPATLAPVSPGRMSRSDRPHLDSGRAGGTSDSVRRGAWPGRIQFSSSSCSSAPTAGAAAAAAAAAGNTDAASCSETATPISVPAAPEAAGDARIVLTHPAEGAASLPSDTDALQGGKAEDGEVSEVLPGATWPAARVNTASGNGGDGGGGVECRGVSGAQSVPLAPIVISRAPTWTAASSTGGYTAGNAAMIAPKLQSYDDVAAEADRVAAMDGQEVVRTPIVVRNLAKIFTKSRRGGSGGDKGASWLNCCCRPQRCHVAVRTLTLAIERGECFGLLGPNGAGKSTSINMLTGFLEPTSGDALVEGCSVRTRMPEIYPMMGVCPQENLLWEQLTGEEHLLFYGRLKGLKGKDLRNLVDAALKSVKLHLNDAGKRRVSSYSGGMKRRLSVAISFIGNPQVVYLDEPSTGLDPASRRNLWDVVRSNKEGRAIILTTHSMEEAEILCDRLGIFVDGQLVCIGNPREITSRYAGYLVFTITVGPGHEDAAKAFVAHMSPRSRLTYALGGTFKYELPTTDVSLGGVFDAVAAAKTQMQVLDWGVANATLEEVFIKFARQIGAETRDH